MYRFTNVEMPATIEPEDTSQAAQLLKLYGRVLHPDEPLDTVLEHFEDQAAYAVTAPNGLVVCGANFDVDRREDYAWLDGIVVAAAYRGRHLGRFMVESCAEIARNHGRKQLRLNALQSAVGFYARLGFEPGGAWQQGEKMLFNLG